MEGTQERSLDKILHSLYVQDGFLKAAGFPIREDRLYILCPAGIGDTLFVAALVESLKRYQDEKREVHLIVKENHQIIPDWFSAIDGKVVSGELAYALDIYCIATQTWRYRNFIYGQFKKDMQGRLSYGLAETDPFSLYKKAVFDLPAEAPFVRPSIPEDGQEDPYGIDKDVIILMPYAFSIAPLPMAFWEILAELLKDKGYRLYTNVKDDTEQPVMGTERFTGELGQTVSLCERSRAVISLRSGICDVLAFTSTELYAVDTNVYYHQNWNVAAIGRREGISTFLYREPEDGVMIIQRITAGLHRHSIQ